MTEKKTEAQLTLTDDDIVEAPESSRRGALQLMGVAALGAAVAAFFGGERTAEAQRRCTDSDPNDRVGWGRCRFRRTGITDRDPSDGVGNGRGGYRAAPVYRRRRRGCTDNDPNDGVGRGIRCY